MSEGTVSHADPVKLYKPSSWMTKMDFINQIVLGTNVMVSVHGEHGGGKTAFATLLQPQLDSQIKSVYFAIDTLFDEASFLKSAASQLSIDGDPSWQNLVAYAQSNKQQIVLILDDAHHISESSLEALLTALQSQGSQGYFHVCLVANNAFSMVLNRLEEGAYKEMIHTIDLGHLNEKETKEYVLHRLLTLPEFISEDRAKQFFQHTDGSIVGINSQMASFFNLSGAPNHRGRAGVRDKNVRRISLVAAAVVIAVGLAFTLKPSESGLNPSSGLVRVEKPKVDSEALDPMFLSSIPSYDLAAVRQFLQPTQLRRAELVLYDEEEVGADDSMVVMDKVIVAPRVIQKLPPPTPKPAAEAAKVEPSPKLVAEEPKLASKVESVEPAIVVKPVKKMVTKSMPLKGQYTIQLIASRKQSHIKQFIKRHHLKSDVHILKSQKNGKDWYVLTLGQYSNADDARKAVKHLPQKFAKNKPWIRKLSELDKIG